MSELMTFTVLSFHRHNSEWQIIVYTTIQEDADLGRNRFTPVYCGKDYFYKIEEMPFVTIKKIDVSEYGIRMELHSSMGSDLMRTYVLYHTGGIYCDFDVLWLKSIEEIINIDHIGDPLKFDATICMYQYESGFHSIGVVLAKPESRFIHSWMYYQKRMRKIMSYQLYGNGILNKRFRDVRDIQSLFPTIMFLKYETFYPYSVYELDRLFIDTDLTPLDNKNVLALHWFNGSDIAHEYINSGFERECSMTTILKNEGYI